LLTFICHSHLLLCNNFGLALWIDMVLQPEDPLKLVHLSTIPKIIATNTTDACRFFSVQVTAFKHRDNGESGYETFHLECLMAPNVRWGRTRFPSVNSYVQAMGNTSYSFSFLCFTDPM
jgi:hypothetical protein